MFENILSYMIFLPIIAGFFLLLLPVKQGLARGTGGVVSFLVLLMGFKVFTDFTGSGGLEFVQKVAWCKDAGICYSLGVDGLSLLVLLAGAFLFPLIYLLFETKSRGFYGNMLIAQGAMLGAICAADMILFYIFWEVMLLPIFFMIGLYGGPNRMQAALKITLYTIAGSLFMLAAIIYVGVAYHAQTGIWSFDFVKLATLDLSGPSATAAFFFFMLAFAIKIPLFPFHTWLPDAYTEAPTSATFLLSAVMAKIGVYGAIRFVLPVFGEDLARFALLLAYAGVIGMIYCGIAAIAQKDFKRMLAFSSASHMGVIGLGVFCMNVQALTGTLYQIVAHATSTGVLFLLLGLIEERMKTRSIEDLGGIACKAPVFAVFFAVAMLASVGLPGTSGFIGEFLIILGAVKFNVTLAVLAGTTVIIGVCYMLWMFQRLFFEKSNEKTDGFKDLTVLETVTILPVVVLILLMGIYPQPFLKKVVPAAQEQIAAITAGEKSIAGITVSQIELELSQEKLRPGD